MPTWLQAARSAAKHLGLVAGQLCHAMYGFSHMQQAVDKDSLLIQKYPCFVPNADSRGCLVKKQGLRAVPSSRARRSRTSNVDI